MSRNSLISGLERGRLRSWRRSGATSSAVSSGPEAGSWLTRWPILGMPGVDPVAINRAAAGMLSGANCEHDDELKTAFALLLARHLESLLMVLTAESLASKGHSGLPLLIQPAMAVAGYLLALLETGSANQSGTASDYPGQVRRAAEGLRGIAGVLENMVARAS
jgi:hypothetical protein